MYLIFCNVSIVDNDDIKNVHNINLFSIRTS